MSEKKKKNIQWDALLESAAEMGAVTKLLEGDGNIRQIVTHMQNIRTTMLTRIVAKAGAKNKSKQLTRERTH